MRPSELFGLVLVSLIFWVIVIRLVFAAVRVLS